MNLAALEAALPAFTAGAITDLTNSSTQVYVSDRPRQTPTVTSIEALWQYVESEPDAGGGLGLPLERHTYRLTIMAASATLAARKVWGKEIKAATHFRRAPTGLSDLDHAEVLSFEVGPVGIGDDPGPAQAIATVVFVGEVTTSDAGA